ncbi:MAG: RNA polymerase subunit sigma-70 [Verrucomicrobia bacterium]|nr:RNA polymerase subunit sigma-70 [Verrucomicrobiota bacterium]
MDALAAVETIARESYGRLVAYLSARSRDVAGAEDALSDALHAALTTWPRDGVPQKPEAWLLATARRRLIDESRRTEVRERLAPTVQHMMETLANNGADEAFPDERLKLLFLCAHPAIDATARTPLMLQTVLGLDAARIASAFLVAPATMGQRLVRAKSKIRIAGIPFAVPGAKDLPARLDAVLEAIYAAYNSGWENPTGTDACAGGLATEAIWLTRVLLGLLPNEPEVHGLLSLQLHCEARRAARRSVSGEFVPLSEQDNALWSRPMLEEAERALTVASSFQRVGRFQLEAAIQSVHSHRRLTGRTEWRVIVQLYGELIRHAPTVGALVSRAAALAEAGELPAALRELDEIPTTTITAYQSFWAVRAHVLARLGNVAEARAAYTRAIGLTEDEAIRKFLRQRSAALAE